jgi:hypothetical protein
VRWIGGDVSGRLDAETRALELPALDHPGPRAVRGVRDGKVGLVVVGNVDAPRRQPAEGPAPGEHDVEQGCGVVRIGEPAGKPDHRERTGRGAPGSPGGSGRVRHGAAPW